MNHHWWFYRFFCISTDIHWTFSDSDTLGLALLKVSINDESEASFKQKKAFKDDLGRLSLLSLINEAKIYAEKIPNRSISVHKLRRIVFNLRISWDAPDTWVTEAELYERNASSSLVVKRTRLVCIFFMTFHCWFGQIWSHSKWSDLSARFSFIWITWSLFGGSAAFKWPSWPFAECGEQVVLAHNL